LPELRLPPERLVQPGYSLLPPNEKGWVVVRRDPGRLQLAKRGDARDTTVAIQGGLVQLPASKDSADFVQVIKDGQAKDTDPRRFKMLTHDVVALPGKGTECAKSHAVAEDRSIVRKSGPMILELLGMTCAHPRDPRIGVDVGYSERYNPGERDPAFLDRAEAVLGSVEFTGL